MGRSWMYYTIKVTIKIVTTIGDGTGLDLIWKILIKYSKNTRL